MPLQDTHPTPAFGGFGGKQSKPNPGSDVGQWRRIGILAAHPLWLIAVNLKVLASPFVEHLLNMLAVDSDSSPSPILRKLITM